MARRRISLGLAVDDRTAHMTETALFCRRYGHKWALKATTKRRFNELVARGQQEDHRYCENHCGASWRQLWDLGTGQVLENEREYPKNGEYLLPAGSGRLHRNDARVALFAREHPEFV